MGGKEDCLNRDSHDFGITLMEMQEQEAGEVRKEKGKRKNNCLKACLDDECDDSDKELWKILSLLASAFWLLAVLSLLPSGFCLLPVLLPFRFGDVHDNYRGILGSGNAT
jgi:hypothetical protein